MRLTTPRIRCAILIGIVGSTVLIVRHFEPELSIAIAMSEVRKEYPQAVAYRFKLNKMGRIEEVGIPPAETDVLAIDGQPHS